MKPSWSAVAAFLVISLIAVPVASAQSEDETASGPGGGAPGFVAAPTDFNSSPGSGEAPSAPPSGSFGTGADQYVQVSASAVVDGESSLIDSIDTSHEAMAAVRDAARDHPGAVADVSLPCGEWLWFEIDFETFALLVYEPPVCVAPLVCGAERIDDVYFGAISGGGSGRYGEYLAQVITGIVTIPVVIDVDVDLVNGSLLSALGDAPGDLAIPVFRFCLREDGSFEVDDPAWGVSFGWDTTVDDEYPVASTLASLTQSVSSRIGLYKPQVAMVPPLESGHTFVKFPTWLAVDEPFSPVYANAVSDLGLIEVEVRATLADVSFMLGDVSVNCSIDEMRIYDADLMDPIDDVPPCHHVFESVDEFDVSAQLTYEVEQRVRQRRYVAHPWPDVAWEPHQTQPTITLEADVGTYGVHQLLSLNVNQEIAFIDE